MPYKFNPITQKLDYYAESDMTGVIHTGDNVSSLTNDVGYITGTSLASTLAGYATIAVLAGYATVASLAGYIPYTGASANINTGSFNITTANIDVTGTSSTLNAPTLVSASYSYGRILPSATSSENTGGGTFTADGRYIDIWVIAYIGTFDPADQSTWAVANAGYGDSYNDYHGFNVDTTYSACPDATGIAIVMQDYMTYSSNYVLLPNTAGTYSWGGGDGYYDISTYPVNGAIYSPLGLTATGATRELYVNAFKTPYYTKLYSPSLTVSLTDDGSGRIITDIDVSWNDTNGGVADGYSIKGGAWRNYSKYPLTTSWSYATNGMNLATYTVGVSDWYTNIIGLQSGNIFYDAVNKRIGIFNSSPASTFHVQGVITGTGFSMYGNGTQGNYSVIFGGNGGAQPNIMSGTNSFCTGTGNNYTANNSFIAGTSNTGIGTGGGAMIGSSNYMSGSGWTIGSSNYMYGNSGVILGTYNTINASGSNSCLFGSHNVASASVNQVFAFGYQNTCSASSTYVMGAYLTNSVGASVLLGYNANGIRIQSTLISLYQNIDVAEGKNFSFGLTTGSKIGSSYLHKIGIWGATPIQQPTTSFAAATFTANTGTAVNDASTFDGYTLNQIVKALRSTGLLA